MNLLPFFLLGLLVLPESSIYSPIFPFGKANAHPIHTSSNNNIMESSQAPVLRAIPNPMESSEAPVVGGRTPQRNSLECDACLLLANGLNQTVLHNPKVISIVTTDLEKICQVLPESVQQLCLGAAEQTAPLLLNHLGELIATEGCSDLGICHS
jgi:hypothetical protein